MTVSGILEQVLQDEQTDKPDDHRAHIVNPPDNMHIWIPGMTAWQIVDIARKKHLYVFALCGWAFVPRHDPDAFPACEDCVKMAGELMRSAGE